VDPNKYQECIPYDDVMDFLHTRKQKLGAVSITGGEPTLQEDLLDFLQEVKDLGFLVKLDTNGSRPDVLEQIIERKLVDYWAMDIKAPLHLYNVLTRSEIDSAAIVRSMNLLRAAGTEYEFRTTFFELLFNWKDIRDIRSLLVPGDRFYLQQCRYTDTLEEVLSTSRMELPLADNNYLHLLEHPACQNLIAWGKEQQIEIQIRTI
jgi:pyruvate formate lyase activating enzyme